MRSSGVMTQHEGSAGKVREGRREGETEVRKGEMEREEEKEEEWKSHGKNSGSCQIKKKKKLRLKDSNCDMMIQEHVPEKYNG